MKPPQELVSDSRSSAIWRPCTMARFRSRKDQWAGCALVLDYRHADRATRPAPVYVRGFRSAFAIRGAGAGHERRQDVDVQNAIALFPVMTCSCFTKLESRHVGHSGCGGCEACWCDNVRCAAMTDV